MSTLCKLLRNYYYNIIVSHLSAKQDIKPEVYFNLGYVHVLQKTYNKSRRFLKLYVELEKNPQYVKRAQTILETLDVN